MYAHIHRNMKLKILSLQVSKPALMFKAAKKCDFLNWRCWLIFLKDTRYNSSDGFVSKQTFLSYLCCLHIRIDGRFQNHNCTSVIWQTTRHFCSLEEQKWWSVDWNDALIFETLRSSRRNFSLNRLHLVGIAVIWSWYWLLFWTLGGIKNILKRKENW